MIFFSVLAAIPNPIYAQQINPEASNFNMWNVVLVGMSIIFVSLVIIAFLVDLLKHFQKREKNNKFSEQKKIISNTISSLKPLLHKEQVSELNHNVQLAILTTIFLYENEIENQSKMLLTMKRTKTSAWKQGIRFLMPNYGFTKKY
jgi:hypothetical protein